MGHKQSSPSIFNKEKEMQQIVRMVSGLLVVITALGTTGCATWVSHDRPAIPEGYRTTRSLPIKAVEVRCTARAFGGAVSRDTDTDCPLFAKFKITHTNGKSEEGLINPDQTAHHEPIQLTPLPPYQQTLASLSPQSYYPDSFNQQIQGARQTEMNMAMAMLADIGYNKLTGPSRYKTLKECRPEDISSFDMELVYPQALDDAQSVWARSIAEELAKMGTVATQPPIILPLSERKRIASFIDTLHQDFPSARLQLPAFYTSTQKYLNSLSESDCILHMEVEGTPDRNMALIIGNGVLSGMTLFILPFQVPEKFTVQSALLDRSGKQLTAVDTTAKMSFVMWIPTMFIMFSHDHCLLTSVPLMASGECRIVTKELCDKYKE